MYDDAETLSILSYLAVPIILLMGPPTQHAYAKRIEIGDMMPEFTLPIVAAPTNSQETAPTQFSYRLGQARVLVLIFLDAKQEQSKRAVGDIQQILDQPRALKKAVFDVVGVQSVVRQSAKSKQHDFGELDFPIGLDVGYQLWGKLGIVVTPTALVIGTDGKVRWIRPAYGYDFASGLRLHLTDALDIKEIAQPKEGMSVSTLTNATDVARAQRRLRLAGLLAEKGQIGPAITELYQAKAYDPNNMEVALTLAEFLCRAQKAAEAKDKTDVIVFSDLP